jgi:tRNA threonylcarbamoyladenosine biosynthesis protein TsaE
VTTLSSTNPSQTRAIGAAVASLLAPGDVVLLVGSLGAGKTTFVKGLVESLGGTEAVTSPTFTLAHLYRTTPPVTHVDLWRLEHLQEVIDLALDEELEEGGAVVVEWGDAAEPLFGSDALVVRIAWGDGQDERIVSFEARGEAWRTRADRLGDMAVDSTPVPDEMAGQG